LLQTVNKIATTVVLISSPNPSLVGAPVSLSATVSATQGTVPNGGTVTFGTNTGVILGTATTQSGIATAAIATLQPQGANLYAKYEGNATLSPSVSLLLLQGVNKIVTTTIISSAQNPAFFGDAVAISAKVAAVTGAIPDGEIVTFKAGPATLGIATMVAGVATISTSALAVGNNPVVATYGGDLNYLPSTSTILVQVMDQVSITTAVTRMHEVVVTDEASKRLLPWPGTVNDLVSWER
jgi:hypothetical protein